MIARAARARLAEPPTLRGVLVPLDGSALGEYALATALGLSRRAGAVLQLFRVHRPGGSVAGPGDEERARRDEERGYLDDVARRMAAGGGHVVAALGEGVVAAAIAARVATVGAGLVVMMSHGRTGISRAWLGSTADGVVRQAPAPVLMLRVPDEADAREHERLERGLELRRILVPLDGSSQAERAIGWAAALASLVSARLELARVVRPVLRSTHPYAYAGSAFRLDEVATRALVAGAAAYLRARLEELRASHRGVDATGEVLVGEDAATTIGERARVLDTDVIALSCDPRGATRMVIADAADRLLETTRLPLLLCGPRAS